jgi:hypothetical protein
VSETRNLRRYAMHKRRAAEVIGDYSIRDVWKAKQEAEPGTTLPDGFPYKARLAALYYVTDTDLDGADECELEALGFSSSEAAAILAAVS